MQRKDIKAGELLAYRRGKYGNATPAVVLDTSTLWRRSYGRFNDKTVYTQVTGWKCYRPQWGGWEDGFLVLVPSGYGNRDAGTLALLRGYVLKLPTSLDEEAINALDKLLPEGLRLDVESNRNLVGPWDVVVADEREEAARRAAETERANARYERERDLIKRLEVDLGSLDVPSYVLHNKHNGRVEISLKTLAQVLGVEYTLDEENPDA